MSKEVKTIFYDEAGELAFSVEINGSHNVPFNFKELDNKRINGSFVLHFVANQFYGIELFYDDKSENVANSD